MDDFAPARQSYLQWYLSSLGMPTLLLIVGVTLIAMVLVVLLFLRGRGPAVPAAILFVLPLPLIVGLICFLAGTIRYLNELAIADGLPVSYDLLSYALVAMTQASSCFCPLLMLSLTFLMVLGFRSQGPKA
jgi:hypothetical protein